MKRKLLKIYPLFACALGLFALNSEATESNQAYLQRIGDETTAFLEDILSAQAPDDELSISVNTPDPRLRLQQCDSPLTYSLHGRARNASNVTVKVSCELAAGWSFYVTADVSRRRLVAVAVNAIPRGDTITARDVETQRRAISAMGTSSYSSAESVVGMAAKRSIRAGEIIRSSQVIAPLAVNKGDQIQIRAKSGSMSVVTSGIAMNKGSVGDQIDVQNLRSERVVRGFIVGPGQVEVPL